MFVKTFGFFWLAIASFGTLIVWIETFILAQQPNSTPWDIGKDITLAAMFTGFLFYVFPAREAAHKAERKELSERLDKNQTASVALLKDITIEHAKTLSTIADSHQKSAESGHEVAAALASEIRDLKAKVEKCSTKI